MAREQYTATCKYMEGTMVKGYQLVNKETKQKIDRTRDQVCLMLGRGQIDNLSGQIYKDKMIIRGSEALKEVKIASKSATKTETVAQVQQNQINTHVF